MLGFFLTYMFASVAYLTTGIVTILNNHRDNINRNFLSICLNLSMWAFMMAIMHLTDSHETASFYRRIMVANWSTLYVQILYFSIFLTGNKKMYDTLFKNVLIMLIPVGCFVMYSFNPTTSADMLLTSLGWVYELPTDYGFVWDHFFNFYYVLYMTLSIVLILRWKKASDSEREVRQANIIILSFISVFVIGTITDVIFPMIGIALLPPVAIILIFGVIFAMCYTIIKYQLMNITPEGIMMQVYKRMNEGIIITDENDRIMSINAGTENIIGYSHSDLIGKDISYLCDNLKDNTSEFTGMEYILLDKDQVGIQVLMTKNFQYDQFEKILGSVYTFQDISLIIHMQEALEHARQNVEVKVQERTKQLLESNDKLKTEIQLRMEKEEEINRLIYTDFLTNLPNRRYLDLHLTSSVRLSKLSDTKIAVLFLDLNSFKLVNDSLGHEAGDELLQQVANRLRVTLRDDDCICRVGGDEFIILLEKLKNPYAVDRVCTKIINMFEEEFIVRDIPVYVNTSIGVSIYPDDSEDIEVVVENADIAMYKVKEEQKNDYKYYASDMRVGIDEVMYLTNELYRGVELHQFELYYQPQVDSKTDQITGFEALVRWKHPEKGVISPGKFIHLAESTGLIIPLGDWIIREAFEQAKKWSVMSSQPLRIGINLSTKQLMHKELSHTINFMMKKVGIDPSMIEFEITESVFMNDSHVIDENISKIKSLGFGIAIDDFGTEYASLNYLKFLPLNRIKIPREFVEGIGTYQQDEAIITSIITLAHKLNCEIIAEGVEKSIQVDFLKESGCEMIQGYYYYKPMNVMDIDEIFFQDNEVIDF